MNILYIATSFPKANKGSTIYTDLAEELVSQGHTVTVVVSEEKRNTNKTYWYNERGCSILRVKTGNIYDVGLIEKGISILLLEYILKFAIKKHLYKRNFDIILYESPPVTNCGVVSYAKKLFKCKTFLVLKDIFPQNAVDIGIIKDKGILYRFFKNKEQKLYEISDFIGCMSEGNINYLLQHNEKLDRNKVGLFPNTKKITNNISIDKDSNVREQYGIPNNATLVLYGGNMGKPQGLNLLCDAMVKLKEEKDIFFILVGRGTEREKIKNKLNMNNCNNSIQIDNLSRDEYEKIVKEADIGLVMLDHRFTIPNYPSRILSYMEYSIPVIAATDGNTDFKDLIIDSECGLWSNSNDVETFCDNIIKLSKNRCLSKQLGVNGRKYLEINFNVSRSVEIIEEFFNE